MDYFVGLRFLPLSKDHLGAIDALAAPIAHVHHAFQAVLRTEAYAGSIEPACEREGSRNEEGVRRQGEINSKSLEFTFIKVFIKGRCRSQESKKCVNQHEARPATWRRIVNTR